MGVVGWMMDAAADQIPWIPPPLSTKFWNHFSHCPFPPRQQQKKKLGLWFYNTRMDATYPTTTSSACSCSGWMQPATSDSLYLSSIGTLKEFHPAIIHFTLFFFFSSFPSRPDVTHVNQTADPTTLHTYEYARLRVLYVHNYNPECGSVLYIVLSCIFLVCLLNNYRLSHSGKIHLRWVLGWFSMSLCNRQDQSVLT